MNIHSTVVTRTLTAEFYRVNAMFFLVATGFCFGFMRGVDHLALAGYFISSYWLLQIPMLVWVVYTAKVIAYNTHEVHQPRNLFLRSLPLLPFQRKSYIYLLVSLGQLLPAIVYGTFLMLMAVKQQQLDVILVVVIVMAILITITSLSLHRVLVHPEKDNNTPTPIRWLDRHTTKPLSRILTEGVVRLQPGVIYTTKIVACVLIYGVTQLYLYEDYDARLYSMITCAVFSANLAVVYQYQRFETVHLLLLRSLPIKLSSRVRSFLITMAVLCFPEIAMLATNLPEALGVQNYFYSAAFGLSLMMLGYGALYVRDATFDSFTRWIFFVGMGWMILILFGVPLIAGAVFHVLLGTYLLKKHFYSFEPST
jgi:hypothetical protein